MPVRVGRVELVPKATRQLFPLGWWGSGIGGSGVLWQHDALFGKHAAGWGDARGLCLKGTFDIAGKALRTFPWYPLVPVNRPKGMHCGLLE